MLALAVLAGLALPPLADVRPRRPAAAVLGVVLALVACLAVRPMGRLDNPGVLIDAPLPTAARAMTWAPTLRQAWYRVGRRLWKDGTPDGRRLGERFVTQAALYDPNQYPLQLRLGEMRLKLKDYPGAREAFGRVHELRDWVRTPAVPET